MPLVMEILHHAYKRPRDYRLFVSQLRAPLTAPVHHSMMYEGKYGTAGYKGDPQLGSIILRGISLSGDR